MSHEFERGWLAGREAAAQVRQIVRSVTRR